MGSHKGSSSVNIASIDIAIANALMYRSASPVERLNTSKHQSLKVVSCVHKYDGNANGLIDNNLVYHKLVFLEDDPLLLILVFLDTLEGVELESGRSLSPKVGNIPPFQ